MDTFDLTPMEPVPWERPFDATDWLFQIKWDGVRMLAVHRAGDVRLINRRGRCRTAQYPELLAARRFLPPDTVLDGEVVALANGRPSFHSILQRDLSRHTASIRSKQLEYPVTYFVFDLLYYRGEDVRGRPLSSRQQLLCELWPGNQETFHLVESFPSGVQLFAAAAQQQLEGIVAKQRESAYVPGKRSSSWRKVKLFREVHCLVCGYTRRQGQFSALLLGMLQGQQTVYVGSAGSGLRQSDWQQLLPFFSAAASTTPPFAAPPLLRDREVHWLHPVLAARVKFMEWSAELKLRAPVVLDFDTAANVDCSFSGQGV